MSVDTSWLAKLRSRSAHELWVRGQQSVSASVERLRSDGRQSVPHGDALRALLAPEHAGGRNPSATLLARFRHGEGTRFLPGCEDLSATAAAAAAASPDAARRLIERADSIKAGRFDLLGYHALSFGEPIDWMLDPVANRRAPLVHWSRIPYLDASVAGDHKVVWELNRHQYFVTLGQAAWLTGDSQYLRTCVEHLTQWMDANPPKLGINWASSLEIAFRSMSWLWALRFLRQSELLTPALFGRMLSHLHLNARHVETYLSTYFSPNTHLTGEALGLIFIGTLVPELRDAKRWRETGWRILERTLARQIHPDGVYFEQASHYQRYTADFVTHAILLDESNGGSRGTRLRETLRRLLVHLAYLTRPDGTTPLVGDDDGGRLVQLDVRALDDHRGLLSTGATILSDGFLAHAAGTLADETVWLLGSSASTRFGALAPDATRPPSRLFAEGGYGIMRDDWTPDTGHLVMDCGPHGVMSGAHAHADSLAIQLCVGGRTVLSDAGTFTYSEAAERDHFRGAFAHSVAVLDGTPSAVPGRAFGWRRIANARVLAWRSDERADYLEAAHDGYSELGAGASVSRAVLAVRNRYWVVRDRVAGTTDHDLQLHFHCATEVNATPSGHILHLADTEDRTLLSISSFARTVDRPSRFVVAGDWTSRCYGHRTPVWHATLACGRAGNHDVVSLLVPQEAAVVSELATQGGRLFEVVLDEFRDLIAFCAGEPLAHGGVDVFATVAWLRWRRRDDSLCEIVLVDARRLAVDGVKLLPDGPSIELLSAVRQEGGWRVLSSDADDDRLGTPLVHGSAT
jgi:hypothetical protein